MSASEAATENICQPIALYPRTYDWTAPLPCIRRYDVLRAHVRTLSAWNQCRKIVSRIIQLGRKHVGTGEGVSGSDRRPLCPAPLDAKRRGPGELQA